MKKRIVQRIDFSKKYERQFNKAPLKIQKATRRRVALFIRNPHHPLLHNHKLTGQWRSYRSLNITGDWRAIYVSKRHTILFITLGTHSQLYD